MSKSCIVSSTGWLEGTGSSEPVASPWTRSRSISETRKQLEGYLKSRYIGFGGIDTGKGRAIDNHKMGRREETLKHAVHKKHAPQSLQCAEVKIKCLPVAFEAHVFESPVSIFWPSRYMAKGYHGRTAQSKGSARTASPTSLEARPSQPPGPQHGPAWHEPGC